MSHDEDRQRWEMGEFCPGCRDVLRAWRVPAAVGVLLALAWWLAGGAQW